MTIAYFLFLVFFSFGILLILQKENRLEFVGYARLLWRTWSVWLGTLGATVGALLLQFPDVALTVWNSLPEDLKLVLPQQVVNYLSPTIMLLAIVSQYIRQSKLKAKMDALEADKTNLG